MEPDEGLPKIQPLDIYWLREPEAQVLRNFLVIFDVVIDELEVAVEHRMPGSRLQIHQRVEMVTGWGVWSGVDRTLFYDCLAYRGAIMARGEQGVRAARMEHDMMNLIAMLGQLRRLSR